MLTAIGYEQHKPVNFKQSRIDLQNPLPEVKRWISWLSLCKRSSAKHPSNSYGVKPRVEKCYDTHIPNGAFIAAVLYLEIKH